jgi:hypothetical protein
MNMQPVKSSHITHIGHEGNLLHVAYTGGKTYVYPNCTDELFSSIMSAESIGKQLRATGLRHSAILDSDPIEAAPLTEPDETPLQASQEVEIKTETLTLHDQATALTVSDQQTYTAAGELGKGLKALEKKITEYFAPMKKAAHEAHKAITKKESDELAPVTEAIEIVRKTMNAYVQEEDRKQKEATRKAQIAADEAAAVERKKLMDQAEKALDKGRDEKAESLMEKADLVYSAPVYVAPVVAKTVQSASGNITQAKETHIEVIDIKLFVAELVKQGSAMTMLEVKTASLKSWVKANAIEKFPGLIIRQTVGVRL